jgi:formate dehydrogenase subunit delta
MHVENLIKMANQIGAFFEAMPDHDEAVADVARHLRNSWEPRMRAALLQHVGAEGDAGFKPGLQSELKPIVLEALALLRKG